MTTDRCEEGGQRRRRQYYVLEGTVPVPLPNLDVKTMRSWSETAYRCVARTDLTPEVEVTTVFLGVDQGPTLDGPPLLFATGVDGGPLEGEDGFYSTWPEAEQGHEAMCTRVRATLAIAGLPPCPPGSLCEVCLDA